MLLRRIGVMLAAIAAVLAMRGQAQPDLVRVLFIGNSLTAGNDVPGLVQEMARQQGVALDCVGIAPGGYDLSDHWNAGHRSTLASGMYDVLVLQQGPSTQPDSQAHLREWTLRWSEEARRLGVQPALYMPWPVRTQANGFALVSTSYRNAAVAAEIPIFATGESWERALRANPNLGLYSGDDFHANPAGSFLAAMVIGRGLFALDPARVPAAVGNVSVSATQLTTFRAVVGALPAATLSGIPVPAAGNPGLPPVPAPAAPAGGAAAGPSGGGGSPSLPFLAVLALAALARRQFRGGRASIE